MYVYRGNLLNPCSCPSYDETGQTDESGEQIIEAALLQHLSQEEKQSVLQTMAAADIDDLELFARWGSQLCVHVRIDWQRL